MTGKERLKRKQTTFVWPHLQRTEAVKKWPADMLINMALSELVPNVCQLPFDYLYRDDPNAMTETSLLVTEWLDIDSIGVDYDGYNYTAEAMGAKLRFFTDHISGIDCNDYFIKDADDLEKVYFGGIDTGRYRYLIECFRAIEKYVGLNQFPGVCGPWSIACNLFTFIKACQLYGAVDTNENTHFTIPYNFQSFEDFLIYKLNNNVEDYTFDWLSRSGFSYLKCL